MKQKIILIILLITCNFFSLKLNAQVGEIEDLFKNEASSSEKESNKDNTKELDSETISIAAQLIGALFNGMGEVISDAQLTVIENKDQFPEVVSLESTISAGIYLNENGNNFCPRIQGNYGLFSSEFRYTYLTDLTGQLGTFDWQILKINAPINPIRLSAGVGFVAIPEYSKSTIEASARLDVWALKRKLNVSTEYRTTGKISSNRFRQEFNFQIDYKIKTIGRFHLSPMIGIKQQSYFEQIDQTYFIAGVNFRFY